MPSVLVTRTACRYTEPAVSSQVVAETIYNTHCAYPRKDVHVGSVGLGGLYTKIHETVTHLSTNRARRRATLLICTTSLPLSQTANILLHRRL